MIGPSHRRINGELDVTVLVIDLGYIRVVRGVGSPEIIGITDGNIQGNEYASRLKAANIAVDHTCWPGMIHGFASVAGVVDAGKAMIDQVGSALRRAFE